MSFNIKLTANFFGSRKTIALDSSYITKSGKDISHIGRFWSGCAGVVKKELELSGIAVMDNKVVAAIKGIIDEDVDKTIQDSTKISREGMNETDKLVLNFMKNK